MRSSSARLFERVRLYSICTFLLENFFLQDYKKVYFTYQLWENRVESPISCTCSNQSRFCNISNSIVPN
jgi:hypothetical protein